MDTLLAKVSEELASLKEAKPWFRKVLQEPCEAPHPPSIYNPRYDADGPNSIWEAECLIDGPKGAYEHPIHVRLKGDAGYPNDTMLSVTILGTVYHHMIMDHMPINGAFEDSFESLGLAPTCANVLEHVRTMLKEPLHPCEDCNLAYMQYAHLHASRLAAIDAYTPHRLVPALYHQEWPREWFHREMQNVMESEKDFQSIIHTESEGVYSFPLFSDEFCKVFLSEVDNFYQKAEEHNLPIKRPNSMNNYGVIVNEIGMEEAISALQAKVFRPISSLLFPKQGQRVDAHHSFIVEYEAKEGKDTHLDMHIDDSDVTFNVCLGREFTGAGLTFCGGVGKPNHRIQSLQYAHKIGYCVVHLGTQRHGADSITSGSRANLIIWNHDSVFRSSPLYKAHERNYETEQGPPDTVCLSYTHDRDYGVFKKYTNTTLKHKGKGWCPPEPAEYKGFLPEK
eukprot:m.176133 g.176133  ORF g.176133 m.176133 type:complete len:451 (+) comp15438_c0_seq5:267-1619(+)